MGTLPKFYPMINYNGFPKVIISFLIICFCDIFHGPPSLRHFFQTKYAWFMTLTKCTKNIFPTCVNIFFTYEHARESFMRTLLYRTVASKEYVNTLRKYIFSTFCHSRESCILGLKKMSQGSGSMKNFIKFINLKEIIT